MIFLKYLSVFVLIAVSVEARLGTEEEWSAVPERLLKGSKSPKSSKTPKGGADRRLDTVEEWSAFPERLLKSTKAPKSSKLPKGAISF